MFGAGARISQALAMTWSDINLKSATALIRQTRINDESVAHLPPRVVAALANIPSNHFPDGSVFRYVHRTTARQVWNNAIKRAGTSSYHFTVAVTASRQVCFMRAWTLSRSPKKVVGKW